MTNRRALLAALSFPAWAGAASAQVAPAAGQDTSAPRAGAPVETLDRTASADETGSDWEYEVNIDLASDSVFRGVDQTNRRLAGMADVSASYKSVYLGVATANIDYRPFGDRRTDQEIDGYIGYKDEAFGYTYDVGVIYYGYLHQPGGIDYVEGYLRGARQIGPLKLGAAFYAASSSGVEGRGGVYAEGEAAYRIGRKWTVSGAVGHGTDASDYLNWNIGAAYAVTKFVSADLRYSDTDVHNLGRAYGSRLIASLKVRFP